MIERRYMTQGNTAGRVWPYPGQSEDTPDPAPEATRALYRSRYETALGRCKQQVANGRQPCREDVAMVTRYASLFVSTLAGHDERPWATGKPGRYVGGIDLLDTRP